MALSDYDSVINEAAQSWNLDPNLLRSMILQESAANPAAVSKKGAKGLTGLMPDTATGMGVTDIKDPVQQIYGGAKYLSQALDAEKSVPGALLYYHGGPGWRGAYGPESAGYVPAVAGHYARLTKSPAAVPATSGVPSDDDFLNHVAPTAPTPGKATSRQSGIPSDEDFLKSVDVEPSGAVIPSQAAALPAVHPSAPTTEGPSPPALPPRQAQSISPGQTTPNDDPYSTEGRDEWGRALYPLAPSTQSSGVEDLANAIGRGAKEGFGQGPLGLSAPVTSALQSSGIYPPEGQTGTPLQFFNKALINPLAAGADFALRGGGAILRGAQAGLSELGSQLPAGHTFSANSATPFGRFLDKGLSSLASPQLALRDLAAAPEAFPTGINPMGAGSTVNPRVPEPGVPNPLSTFTPPGAPRDYLSPDFRANPGVTTQQSNLLSGPSSLNRPLIEEMRNPLTTNAPTEANPRSVGAAATPPEAGLNISPKMEQAYRSVAEGQKLNEPQPSGIPDYNEYVPKVSPTQAHLEQSANVSREQKMLESQIPEEFKAVAAANNEARQQHFNKLAGSDVDIQNAVDARASQAEKDINQAFSTRKPVDATPVVDTISNILNDPQGKENSQLKTYVKPLLDRLTNEDGTLKNDPLQLYGLRQDIYRMNQKANAKLPTEEGNNLKFITGQLGQIMDSLDKTIEKGAPGYQRYLNNFSEASRPIDTMQALQGFENKLYDTQGRMQLSRVQNMMKNIVDARASPGNNPYKSIPDETMAELWKLRDDLRRVASADELARAKGSDTAQNAMDIVKDVARHGIGAAAQGAAHMIAGSVSPGLGNWAVHQGNSLLNALMSSRRQNQLQSRAAQMAHPTTPLNPLQSP